MIVSVRAPQLPGPSSVPSSRIVVHGFDATGFAVRDDVRVGLERRHLTGAEPLHECPLPRVLRHPLRQGMDDVGEQHRAAVARRAARLLVGEDALEHVVAAHRHPRRRHVRRCGERDEDGDEDRESAPSGVDDGEHAKRQQGEIDREDRRYDRAVDPGEGVQRDPRAEDRAADDDARPEDEQDEPAARRAPIQLADARHEQRQKPGDEHRPSVCPLFGHDARGCQCWVRSAGPRGTTCSGWRDSRPFGPPFPSSRSPLAARCPASPPTPTGGPAVTRAATSTPPARSSPREPACASCCPFSSQWVLQGSSALAGHGAATRTAATG